MTLQEILNELYLVKLRMVSISPMSIEFKDLTIVLMALYESAINQLTAKQKEAA